MSEQRAKSKYAQKVASKKQVYGPGCCAHTISEAQVAAAKREAVRSGHVRQWSRVESNEND